MSPGHRRAVPRARRRARWAVPVVLVVAAAATVLVLVTTTSPVPAGPTSASPVPAGPTSAAPAPPVTRPAAPSPSRAQAAVDSTDEAASSRSGADLGVAVLDLETGDLAANDLGDRAMNAASLTKLVTALDVLDRPEAPSSRDVALIRRALGPSDDDAMNTLWSRTGGSGAMARVIDRVGMEDSSVPGNPSQWGEAQVSARDMARLVGYVRTRLAPDDRDLVLSSLAFAPPVATDGFDQAYGLLAPGARGAAAAKQGWLCCLRSSIDLHSAGVLSPDGRYAVALLSNQPFGYDAARRVLDDAAAAVRAALS